MLENGLNTALQNLFRGKIAQYEKLTPRDKIHTKNDKQRQKNYRKAQ